VKVLAVEGVRPSRKNVRSGRYPVVRELDLLANPGVDEKTKTFIDFTAGPEGQRILGETLRN